MNINIKLVGFLSLTGLHEGFTGGVVVLENNSHVFDLLGKIGVSTSDPYLIVRDQKILSMDDELFNEDVIQIVPPISGG